MQRPMHIGHMEKLPQRTKPLRHVFTRVRRLIADFCLSVPQGGMLPDKIHRSIEPFENAVKDAM